MRCFVDFPERLFAADDFDGAYERAVKHGARPIDLPLPDSAHFVVSDPDGILIEVIQMDLP